MSVGMSSFVETMNYTRKSVPFLPVPNQTPNAIGFCIACFSVFIFEMIIKNGIVYRIV